MSSSSFVDEISIEVISGCGGNGALSFRREKFIPRGGPDGGNGGDGGNVWLIGDKNLNTLVKFRYKNKFQALNGSHGKGQNQKGGDAKDIYIKLPLGTLVYERYSNNLLWDICYDKMKIKVAKGGCGGIGNSSFKSSQLKAPRKITYGQIGEIHKLHLELQLLADVALVGLPNSGKSTLLRSVSNANPKVESYPFTTTFPNLGVVKFDFTNSFSMVDVPGIIEGSTKGKGLSYHFLKHINRSKILLQIVDVTSKEISPLRAIELLNFELTNFDAKLLTKPRFLVLNKIDLLSKKALEKKIDLMKNNLHVAEKIFFISAENRTGIEKLINALFTLLNQDELSCFS